MKMLLKTAIFVSIFVVSGILFAGCDAKNGETNIFQEKLTQQGDGVIEPVRVRKSQDQKSAEVLWNVNVSLPQTVQTYAGFGRCAVMARNEFQKGIRWKILGTLMNAETNQYMASLDYDVMVRDYLAVPGENACVRVFLENEGKRMATAQVQRVPIPDTNAPQFQGLLETNKNGETIELVWKKAADISRPIRYRIYENPSGDCAKLNSPIETDGMPSARNGYLSYEHKNNGNVKVTSFVMRAVDRAGNEDGNCNIKTIEF